MATPNISQWFPKLTQYGSLRSQPKNLNLASTTNFRFIADKVPGVTYFCTSVVAPSISSKPREYQYMFGADPKFPGGRSESNVSMRFIISEDFTNYMEIVNWMKSGLPYKSFKGVVLESKSQPCDGKLFLLNNKKNPVKMITFSFMIPISISGFTLLHSEGDPTILSATTTFVYDDYKVEDLKSDTTID